MKKSVQTLLNTVGPIVVVFVAVMGFRALVASREAPERARPETPGMLVEVFEVTATPAPMVVNGQGTVIPARQVNIQPQVSGRLTALHDQLVVGGRIAAGDDLFDIDTADYRIAVDQARANLAQAEAALEIERGRARVAEREWELFQAEAGGGDPGLATRAPHVRSAEVAVELAEIGLRRARLDASRTSVEAPFDAIVLSESAELGQLVTPQSPLATLAATDVYWVRVNVPMGALAGLRVPGVNATEGSPATVTQVIDGNTFERSGRVIRVLGQLSEVGRMAQLVVEIDAPLDPGTDDLPPLLLGSFVRVSLDGARLDAVVGVPRDAIRRGDSVYVAGDGALEIRPVSIAWRDENTVFVSDGLTTGERIVVSPVPTAVDGMPIRVAGESAEQGEPDA